MITVHGSLVSPFKFYHSKSFYSTFQSHVMLFGYSWIYTILIFKPSVFCFILFNPDSCVKIPLNLPRHLCFLPVLATGLVENSDASCQHQFFLRFVLLNCWDFVKSVMETRFLKSQERHLNKCTKQNTNISNTRTTSLIIIITMLLTRYSRHNILYSVKSSPSTFTLYCKA